MIDRAVPPDSLKNRRQALRNQRRSRGWQSLARFFVVGGLATGLAWGMAGPRWTIRANEQVKVAGNHLVSDTSLRSSLKLSYPLSIWELPIEHYRQTLAANPAIATVGIERQLFPPEMRIEIRERQPVARVRSPRGEGFIDAVGNLIPKRYYDQYAATTPLPTLEAIGYSEQYRTRWQKLYPYLQTFPIKVTAIDWRSPSNLVLKTELGKVNFGDPDSRLSEKLSALVQTRQLATKIPLDQILYIDLSDPDAPTVQVKPKPTPSPAKAPPTPR
jgi:cell division protein FtsQ